MLAGFNKHNQAELTLEKQEGHRNKKTFQNTMQRNLQSNPLLRKSECSHWDAGFMMLIRPDVPDEDIIIQGQNFFPPRMEFKLSVHFILVTAFVTSVLYLHAAPNLYCI